MNKLRNGILMGIVVGGMLLANMVIGAGLTPVSKQDAHKTGLMGFRAKVNAIIAEINGNLGVGTNLVVAGDMTIGGYSIQGTLGASGNYTVAVVGSQTIGEYATVRSRYPVMGPNATAEYFIQSGDFTVGAAVVFPVAYSATPKMVMSDTSVIVGRNIAAYPVSRTATGFTAAGYAASTGEWIAKGLRTY